MNPQPKRQVMNEWRKKERSFCLLMIGFWRVTGRNVCHFMGCIGNIVGGIFGVGGMFGNAVNTGAINAIDDIRPVGTFDAGFALVAAPRLGFRGKSTVAIDARCRRGTLLFTNPGKKTGDGCMDGFKTGTGSRSGDIIDPGDAALSAIFRPGLLLTTQITLNPRDGDQGPDSGPCEGERPAKLHELTSV